MRQGIFTPNRPAISALTKLLIFLIFVYTPRGLMEKAVASELIDCWFKSWSGKIFFFILFHCKFFGTRINATEQNLTIIVNLYTQLNL